MDNLIKKYNYLEEKIINQDDINLLNEKSMLKLDININQKFNELCSEKINNQNSNITSKLFVDTIGTIGLYDGSIFPFFENNGLKFSIEIEPTTGLIINWNKNKYNEYIINLKKSNLTVVDNELKNKLGIDFIDEKIDELNQF